MNAALNVGRLVRVGLLAAGSSIVLAASSVGLTQNMASTQTGSSALADMPARPSSAEVMRLRDGLAAAESGDWGTLLSLRDGATDPLVRKMLLWRFASATAAPLSFSEIADALRSMPDWPARTTVRQRAEQAIFNSTLTPDERIAFLRDAGGPTSGDGRVALAQALKASGQRTEANDLARSAWRENTLTPTARAAAQADFGSVISQNDDADRASMLIWRGERTEARGLFPRLSPADRALGAARIALQTRQRRGLQRAVDAVPASRTDDPGLKYDRAQYVRRAGRPEDAMTIAANIDARAAPAVARADIYEEKRLYVPRALRNGSSRLAYNLVTNTGLTSGESFADAEWMAGWLALRRLNDNALAASHFSHLADNVSSPVSRSRALYWRAEAARAQGDAAGADSMLAEAARYDFTYYGQLAAAKRGGTVMLSLQAPTPASAEVQARFNNRELVRALRLMAEVGAQRDFESIAFYLDDTLNDPQEMELLSQLAREQSYNRTALRSAKAGLFRGVVAVNAAYPLLDLPPQITQRNNPEPALVLAIIRQESEFEVSAVSHANAHGLMQLIPSTARTQARQEGMDYTRGALTSDANYNITLGASHLGSLIDEFGGSYVLAIAAYNAGSHRSREWIADWGDPRSTSVDVVDWVELIPFAETRNYVQRVMENLQVYRYRLSNQPTPIALMQDLRRGS